MPEISPDFEEHDKYISIKKSFSDRNDEKLKLIKAKYKIADDYPLESKITGAYLLYVQENKVISERARKETSRTIQHIADLNFDLIDSIEQLDWGTKAFLSDGFGKLDYSQENFLALLKRTHETYQLAIQDLLVHIKNNREKRIVEDRLAARLSSLFIEISHQKPTIYSNAYYDSQKNDSHKYRGNLAEFLYLVDELFHPIPDLNLLSRAQNLRRKTPVQAK